MKKQFTLIFFIMFCLLSGIEAKVNSDSIFNRAIFLAKNQQYTISIIEAKKALNFRNDRGDILVFIANAYSLDNKNDSAIQYIQLAKKIGYHQDDFYAIWSSILLQDHKFEALLECCKEAEADNYSNKEDIFRKRLIAYTELKKYNDGVYLLKEPQNNKYLESKDINDIYTYLIYERNINIISINYMLNILEKGNIPQQLASLGYSLKVGENRFGMVVNYSYEPKANHIQFGTDNRLFLGTDKYLYIKYYYSYKASLFPQHQASMEYYFPLPFHFGSSVGGRYIYYEKLKSNVFVATVHLDKYIYSSWLSIRPYYIYNYSTKKNSFSLMGNYRLFNKNEFSYWGVEIDHGFSPDDLYSTTKSSGFNQLAAFKIKLDKNFMINRISDFNIGVSYTSEELILDHFSKRYSIDAGYKIRLK